MAGLAKLLPKHYNILQLVINGASHEEISRAVGMSEAGVGMILRSPLFQDELARRRQKGMETTHDENLSTNLQVKEILDRASVKAASVHEDLLSHADPRIQQISANAILDRTYGSVDSKTPQVVVLNAERLQVLQIALQESRDLQTV